MPNIERPLTRKVLLIGWDAADWKVITPLMEAGKMPHLQCLVESGVMGNLATLYPILSPMLWTSIATGKRAHKHGILGFAEPNPQKGGTRPITNLGRKTKALWNILHQMGFKSNVVGWWPSHPAEPINGVMVSNHYQEALKDPDKPWPMSPGTVHPLRLAKALAEFRVHPSEIEAEQILPFVPRAAEVDQEKDKRLGQIAKILAECASIQGAVTALMAMEPWDFTAVYFDAIDHFCHGFMRYHPPRLPWVREEDFELYKDIVNGAYQFHDLMLGVLMQLAGPDTTILLCSDHGFHSDHLRPRVLPNEPAGPAEEHRHFGIFAAMGPGIRKDELVFGANLLDITPTILHLLGLPIGKDMDGKPLVGAMQDPPEVRYIESWDEIPGDAGMHPPGMQVDAVDAHASLQQLVDLGYIDEIDGDREEAAQKTVKELKYNQARDLMDANRYAQAIPILNELWDEYQDESRFGVQLFECYMALDYLQKARQTLDEVIKRKEKYAKAAQKELESLEQTFKTLVEEKKEPTRAQLQRLQRVRGKAKTNWRSIAYYQGRLLAKEKRYSEALEAFEKAEKFQMHNRPSLLQHRGEVYLAMRRWADAEKCFNKILEIDPVNAQAYFGLARVRLMVRHRAKEALDAITASLGLVYHNPQGHYLCAVALERLGRMADAKKALQVAIAQNPVFPAAHRRLARLYRLYLNDPKQAKQHMRLARHARERIIRFQQKGEVPDEFTDFAAEEALLERPASLGEAGAPQKLPPLEADEIVIVSGLPRSGTSMMMQMLHAGGLPVLTDHKRAADEDNPRGYFEYELAKRQGDSRQWLEEAKGKVVKVVAQLLPGLHLDYRYRIIFMERPLAEILASQQKMLERLGKKGGRLNRAQQARAYLKDIQRVRAILEQSAEQVRLLSVDYHRALEDPAKVVREVNDFLGEQLDEQAMIAAIAPNLRRQFMTVAERAEV